MTTFSSTSPTVLILQGSPADYTFITDSGRLAIGDHVANRDGLIQTQLSSITSIQFLGCNQTYALADVPVKSAMEYIASHADLRSRLGTNAAAGYTDYVNYGYLLNRTVTFDALKYIASSSDLMSVFGADRVAGARHAIIYYYAYAESSWRANDQTIQTQVVANGVHVLEGTLGNDGLFGLDGDDRLYGAAGSDGLSGGAGNDWLDGGTGADRMAGGKGNDTYIVDNSGDIVDESTNGNGSGDAGGIDTVRSSISFSLQKSTALRGLVDNLVLTGPDNINGIGNSLNNLMIGNSGDNRLNGAAGNDTLDGGAGTDRMMGGSGNDAYVVDNANDVVDEGIDGYSTPDAGGIDTVTSSVSFSLSDADHTIGKIEGLALTGSANINASGDDANNVLIGNSGDNILQGGAGNDVLFGGAGNDTLIGGKGNDIYYFDANSGNDLIIGEHSPSIYHETLVINARFDQLVFRRSGDDLTIEIKGSQTASGTVPSITIENHFSNPAYQIEQIICRDKTGLTMGDASLSWSTSTDNQISRLVSAMAAMGAPATNGSGLTAANIQTRVEALFAANVMS